jgi:predicted enzyme related to lactoylglutathione lyase
VYTNSFKITLKKDAPKEQLDAAKKHVTDQGGKIVNEFTLIKGFTYVSALPLPSP